MKKRLRFFSLIISLIVSALVFTAVSCHKLDNLEFKSLDWRFRMRGAESLVSPVVVAAIDDNSLSTIGKWPWPRKIHGDLIDICRKAGAAAVVFDVLFLEPDRYDASNDRILGEAIKKYGKVILPFDFKFETIEQTENNEKGDEIQKREMIVEKDEPISQSRYARALGFVNAIPDDDGTLRKSILSYDYKGKTYYSLGVQSLAMVEGKSPEDLFENIHVIESNYYGNRTRQAWVNWRGPEELFVSHSCAEILDAEVPLDWKKQWLGGKIVIVGSTALGLYDHYPTAFSPSFPGLYMHANVIDNLWSRQRTQDFLKPLSKTLTHVLIFLFAILVGAFISNFSATWGAVSTVALAAAFWTVGYFLMVKKFYYIELVAPTISLVGSYIAVFFYRFIVEQREKAGIKKAFGVYVNPHVVDAIAKNPEALKLGGEQREMTVMFSDVAGFTTISEKLSPSELVQLLNLYLTAMTDTIMRLDGTVDKYEGDAIMAFWGAPLAQPAHAKMACLAVLENRERLKQLNVELKAKGMNELFARCGLNTGPMNVGNMGSSQKFNYTVMGDAVNLASRLEGANKQYGTMLMVSETTYAAAKDEIEVRELDLLRVKGKKLPIKVFELVSKKGGLTEEQKKAFAIYDSALELYRKRDFKSALSKFGQVTEILPKDGPSETYSGRCNDYLKTPPPADWDGVFVMTTK